MFSLSPLPRNLAAAVRDLSHPKAEVKSSAIRDLGRIAARSETERQQALDALEGVLVDSGSESARIEAAITLADCEANDRTPALLRVSADEEVAVRVRQMALMALGELAQPGDASVLEVLASAVQHEEPALRYQALIVASRVEPGYGQEACLQAAEDQDVEVRYLALRLLDEHSVDHELIGAARARALRALEDEAPSVRLAAAILLGRHGDAAGEAELLAALARGGVDPQDEQAAIEVVAELGLSAAVPQLARRAWRGFSRHPFAWHARVALARLGHPKAQATILRELRSWSWDTRTLAVVAVGQARLSAARRELEGMRASPSRAEPEVVEAALELLGEDAS